MKQSTGEEFLLERSEMQYLKNPVEYKKWSQDYRSLSKLKIDRAVGSRFLLSFYPPTLHLLEIRYERYGGYYYTPNALCDCNL